jgi:hypothetical protein
MFAFLIPRNLWTFFRTWWTLIFIILPILACAPGSSGYMVSTDEVVPPENFVIGGAPQWVGLTATPIPTHTQFPTATQYSTVVPASNYVTNTPYPGSVYQCAYVLVGTVYQYVCSYATNTPYPGGYFSTPSYVVKGPTATPRATYTPYPSATPCMSFGHFYYGEYVYTRYSNTDLDLRILVSDIEQQASSEPQHTGRQLVSFNLEIQNRGSYEFVIFPQLQLFIAEVDDSWGPWPISIEAIELLGLDLTREDLELLRIPAGQTLSWRFAAIVPEGEVTSIGWVMDPTISSYQDRLVGGNMTYWDSGERPGDCSNGAIGTSAPVPTLSSPLPTASPTVSN